jgi:LPS export ABC transporter protein LptC
MIEFLMRKVVLIGLSILLFGSFFLMLTTGKEPDRELRIASGSFIEGIRILQKKKGVTLWDLTASRADFETEDKAALTDVSISLQKSDVVLRADKGVYNLSEKSFATNSAVKAQGKDYTINTDSVDFDVSSGNIKTGGKVKLEGKGFEIEGKGMNAETEKKVKIYNDVTATFHK